MPRTAKRGGPRSKTPARPPAPEHPWERQPDETDKAYEAFRAYLELGPGRTLREVETKLGKSRQLISRWSSKHGWVGRADAFEAEGHKRADDATLDAIAERAKRQAQIAQLNQEALALPAKELLERLQRNPQLLATMPIGELLAAVGQAARALPRVVQTERLVTGQSTSNAAGHDGGPLEGSDAARRRAEAEADVATWPDEKLQAFLLGAEAQRQAAEEAAAKG